jgi:hypothetical protein
VAAYSTGERNKKHTTYTTFDDHLWSVPKAAVAAAAEVLEEVNLVIRPLPRTEAATAAASLMTLP